MKQRIGENLLATRPGSSIYIPDRGDIVWLNFDPQAGHEHSKRRPAIVITPMVYNAMRFHLNVNREQIIKTGKAYHSRHGEDFYLEQPETGDLFPSKELIAMPDAVTLEAAQIGWDTSVPVRDWNEWQKDCWLYATLAKSTLRQAIDLWKSGKLEAAWKEWRDNRYRLDL